MKFVVSYKVIFMNKKCKFGLILLFFFLISLSVINIKVGVAQSSDIVYSFAEKPFYEGNSPIPDSYENLANQTIFSNIYNGTYSFTYDSNGNLPVGWNARSGSGCSTNVYSYLSGHDKILDVYDNSASTYAGVDVPFSSGQSTGTVEYWVMTTNNNYVMDIFLSQDYDATEYGLHFSIRSGYFQYYDGSFHNVMAISNNVWYHVKLVFSCTTDTYNIYINGVIRKSSASFRSACTTLNELVLQTDNTQTNYHGYWDAFGFSWNDYSVGNNVIPYNYETDELLRKSWTFANYPDGSQTESLDEDIPYWDEPSGTPYIGTFGLDYRSCTFLTFSTTPNTISHEFSESNGYFEIYTYTYFSTFYSGGSATHYYQFNIYSYDDTLIGKISFHGTTSLSLYYYNGSSYVLLTSGIGTGYKAMTIYYGNNVFALNYGGVVYYFSSLDISKLGLGKIEVSGFASVNDAYSFNGYLDSISVMNNGTTLTEDYANIYYDFDNLNIGVPLFTEINASGSFSVGVYDPSIPYYYDYISYQEFNGFYRFYNGYISTNNITDGQFKVMYNSSYTVETLKVYSLCMDDGNDYYYGSFSFGNVNITESYYYVSNSRLYFSLECNDTNLEYVEMTFDISDISSSGYAIQFNGWMYSTPHSVLYTDGAFYCDFYDSTSYEFLFNDENYVSVALPSNEIISFSVLITDNDNNLATDSITTGYITSITLVEISGIGMNIISTNLMDMIMLLIMIFAPAFLMAGGSEVLKRKRGGEQKRYFGLTPSMIIIPVGVVLMSIFAYSYELIPLWLLTIILFAIGLLLIFSRDKNKD